jgi:hypothetical protein
VKRDLFGHLTSDREDYSLGQLARAIATAPRRDGMPVWRAFVRTRGYNIVPAQPRTQRLRLADLAAR